MLHKNLPRGNICYIGHLRVILTLILQPDLSRISCFDSLITIKGHQPVQ